jgi:GGDEF domain-containing protein
MFRWSGDEFVIFFEVRADEAEIKFKDFCADIKEALDISVSVGVVDIDLSQSIKTNYHRAVQMCYAVKAAGGNGVKRET